MNPKIKILLIEDNPSDAKLVDIYLKEALGNDYFITNVNRLTDGLHFLTTDKFDVIISDINLPDSSGMDTFLKVIGAISEIPIIILTGLGDESFGVEAVKKGAADFLDKNQLNSQILKRSIIYSIERHNLQQELQVAKEGLEKKVVERTKELQSANLFLKKEIVERGKAQQITKQSEERLNNFMNSATDYFYLFDENFRLIDINEAGIKLFGAKSKEELLGKALNQLSPGIEQTERYEKYLEVLKTGKPQTTADYSHPKFENQFFRATAFKTGKGLGIISRDITKQKAYEEQIKKLNWAVSKTTNAVVIAGKDGKIEWVNDGFTKLTGYNFEEVKGTYGEVLNQDGFTGLNPASSHYQLLMRTKQPVDYEVKNRSKSGAEYWTLTTLSPIVNRQGEVEKIIAIDSNITKRKEVEEELLKAKELAEQSMKMKDAFFANMSHEIRTPLNGIVGLTDLLLKTDLNDKQNEYLSAVKQSSNNLLVIINDILDISKIEAGKMELEKEPFDLFELVDNIIRVFSFRAEERGNLLDKIIDEDVPQFYNSDSVRIGQILTNLVSNAVKFTENGKITIQTSLLSQNEKEVEIEIKVSDTGIGIPEEVQGKIFESYIQAKTSITRLFGGTGLGLAIVKKLVNMMGGKLSLQSQENKGATFSFILKLEKATKPIAEKIKQTVSEKVDLDVCVLVVEDNEVNQLLIKETLVDWGCKLDIAENGRIAIEKISTTHYDLVLMDVLMPEMGGIEATQKIRTTLPEPKCNVPIIACTAYAFKSEKQKCIEAGMNDYLAKPMNPDELYQKMQTLIGSSLKLKDRDMQENTSDSMHHYQHIHLEMFEKFTRGKVNSKLSLINLLIEQTPDSLEKMQKYLKEKNWQGVYKVMHNIKPNITLIGINELEPVIANIQKFSKEEINLEELPALVQKLSTVLEESVNELREEKEILSAYSS